MQDGYGKSSNQTSELIRACMSLADKDSEIIELKSELEDKNATITWLIALLILVSIFAVTCGICLISLIIGG